MNFPRYTLSDLGTLPQGVSSNATAINTLQGRPQAVGYSTDSNGASSAFIWEHAQGQAPVLIDLQASTGGNSSVAFGMNNRFPSDVVGWYSFDGYTPVPILWTKDLTMTLPRLGENKGGRAYGGGKARGVNNYRYIVGSGTTASGQRHAVLYVPVRDDSEVGYHYEIIDLDAGGGSDRWASEAYRISNGTDNGKHFQVAGWTTWPDRIRHACRWELDTSIIFSPQGRTVFDLLNPNYFASSTEEAYGINDAGIVVGRETSIYRSLYGQFDSAFKWTAGYYFSGEPSFPGWEPQVAIAINNNNFIVGTSQSRYTAVNGVGDVPHAVISLDRNGADLNDLVDGAPGWILQHANGINESGQIVGRGLAPNGQTRAWLLTPLP